VVSPCSFPSLLLRARVVSPVLFSGFLCLSTGSLTFRLFSSFLLYCGSPLESSGFGVVVAEDGDLT